MKQKSTPKKGVSPAVRQAAAEMLKEGVLVAVEEIDPDTGAIRTRYFHRDHAPKPH